MVLPMLVELIVCVPTTLESRYDALDIFLKYLSGERYAMSVTLEDGVFWKSLGKGNASFFFTFAKAIWNWVHCVS